MNDPQIATITEPALSELERGWEQGGKDIERAYCGVDFWYSRLGSVTAKGYVVDGQSFIWRLQIVERASEKGATDNGIEAIGCPDGVPIIHTHPPDCEITPKGHKKVNCLPNCMPSPEDQELLIAFHAPYGVVQCGYNYFVPYFPRNLRGYEEWTATKRTRQRQSK